jgi:uncharacterized protein (TIRG00374 family)
MQKNKIIIKTIVGISLMSLLLYLVDYKELSSIMRDVEPINLMIMIIIPHIAILISVIKWDWLLKALKIKISLNRLYRLYLVGTFFNNFLPSMVGGDVARVYLLGTGKRSMTSVTAATVIERLTGLAALVSMLVYSALDKLIIEKYPWLSMVSILLVFGFAFFCILIFSRKNYISPAMNINNKIANRVVKFIGSSREQMRIYMGYKVLLLKCYLLSFMFYFLAVLTVYFAAQTIQVEVSIEVLLVVVPIVLMIGLLPISLNGIGVNETGWVVFLSIYGVSLTQAVMIGFLIRARILLTSLIGGVFYLLLKKEMRDIDDV